MRLTEEEIQGKILAAGVECGAALGSSPGPHALAFGKSLARRIERAVLEKVAKRLCEKVCAPFDVINPADAGKFHHDLCWEMRAAAQEGEDAKPCTHRGQDFCDSCESTVR